MLVESGNLSDAPDKLALIMPVYKEMGYDAVGVGDQDITTCKDRFFQEADKAGVSVVYALPGAPKPSVPYRIKNVDGVRVGIVSFGAMPADGNANQYTIRKFYYTAFKQAREASDILVVLDQAGLVNEEWLGRNGARLGTPDVVIQGIGRMGLPQPEVIGKTRFVPTADRTREIGVMDIKIAPGSEPEYNWHRVENYYDTREKKGDAIEDEKVNTMVWAYLRPGQAVPKPGDTVVPEASKHTTPASEATIAEAAQKPYYSPSTCKSCHVKQYEDWAKTKHAAAIETLMKENRMQSECLQCHSEQYRRTRAVTIPEDKIGGVECATCHIDALPHGLERATVSAKSRVSALKCLDCHTKEHSPGYDEQAYFPQISHLGTANPHTAAVPH